MIIHPKHGRCMQCENPERSAVERARWVTYRTGKYHNVTKNRDGSFSVIYDSEYTTFTYLPLAWHEPLTDDDIQVCPLPECEIIFHDWDYDEFEGYVPSSLSSKTFYMVSVQLNDDYDENGLPVCESDEDYLLVTHPEFLERFGINIDFAGFGFFKTWTHESGDWDWVTTNKKNVKAIAKEISKQLAEKGWKPYIESGL